MKTFLIILLLVTINLQAQTLNDIESKRVSLPNGWHLTPVGNMLPLGDLPLNIAVSPSKKLAAITNNGQSDQTIQLVDIERELILGSIIIGKAWLGLTFSSNGKYLYASGADGKEQKIKVQYIGGLFRGTLSILNVPDEKQMALHSKAVYNNTPYNKNTEMISEGAVDN